VEGKEKECQLWGNTAIAHLPAHGGEKLPETDQRPLERRKACGFEGNPKKNSKHKIEAGRRKWGGIGPD